MKIKGIYFVFIGFFMTLTCSHFRLEKAKKKAICPKTDGCKI